jgi:CRISPR system Cascade subunit CasB
MEPETDLIFFQPDVLDALLSWWKELDNAGVDRAALRRCNNPLEVKITPAFHRLKRRLEPFRSMSPDHVDRLAIVAGVLSYVQENKLNGYERNVERAFAVQMTRPPQKWGRRDKACVSGMRFRNLLKIEDPDKLYPTIIRLIRLLGGSVDIASLANGIYWWNERTKKEWAYAYYENAPGEEK